MMLSVFRRVFLVFLILCSVPLVGVAEDEGPVVKAASSQPIEEMQPIKIQQKPHTIQQAQDALDWEGWVTIVVFFLTFAALIKEVRPPDITMLVSTSFLVIIGVLSPKQFLEGFSSDIIMTIAMLCIMVRALEVNGLLEIVGRKVLTVSKKWSMQLLSLCTPVAFGSAFLNNTPIVLLMTPIVRRWSLENKTSPSKFLIPLSYAAVVGGACTIIGTSTNLVIDGLLRRKSPESALSFFELGLIGIPVACLVFFYLLTFGKKLLPNRLDPTSAVAEQTREFTAEFLIDEECPLANKTIQEVSKRFFRNELLIQIERSHVMIESPSPDFILSEGDRLIFAGDINQIAELHAIPGLKSQADPHFQLDVSSSHFSEVVIASTSSLIGKTLKQINFRSVYGCSVIAVYRQGWRILGKVGDIVLQAGDTLMLLSGEPSKQSDYYNKDFYYIRHNEKLSVFHPKRAFWVICVLIAMVFAATAGVPIMIASLAAVFAVVFTKSISLKEAGSSIIWNVLLLIACSFALGRAMETTGVASYFAEIIITLSGKSPHMLIGGILLVTIVSTELLTNNATALILFPIAVQAAYLAGYESIEAIKAVGVTVAVGSSCCYAIPTGYQTHMIVYGPGGYKFTDFIKVGLPLDFLVWGTGTYLIPKIWPLVP